MKFSVSFTELECSTVLSLNTFAIWNISNEPEFFHEIAFILIRTRSLQLPSTY